MTVVTDYGHYYNKLFKGENQHVYSKSYIHKTYYGSGKIFA